MVSKLHSDNALEVAAGKAAVLTFQKKENDMIFFKRGRALNEKVCHGNRSRNDRESGYYL